MLYESEVLQRTDAQGRRLFLREEFDAESGVHQSSQYTTPPNNTALVRGSVFEIASRASVSLSKADFAHAVLEQCPPFSEVGFEGFRPTFEVLQEAVREAAADLKAIPT